MKKPLILIFLILLTDQIIKIYVKTHFYLGEETEVLGLSWFKIHFLENKGMAFGMNFGDTLGKVLLTFVRIAASVFIYIFMRKLVARNENKVIIYSFALILAGAAGNIIDSVFYGVLFSSSTFFQVAAFLPEGGGYAPLFFGKVVDMFYFPLIDTTLPQWLPVVGGRHFSFFDAGFNFSDAAITIGVAMLLIFILVNGKSFSFKTQTDAEK
ncbi:MAG: lipoprotein signal peptidase [Bacteroidales bacterium]|nr:lipoprotein signal peptidase [Bacteroidales bacterium]